MIRIFNITCFFVIVSLVAAVYHIRYSAEVEARKLQTLERKIMAAEDLRQTLAAEWSSLNDPRRLQVLVSQHLTLSPLEAHQVMLPNASTLTLIPVKLLQQERAQ